MTPALRGALACAPAIMLLVAALPVAQAQAPCVETESLPDYQYVRVDPSCVGLPAPVVPGMEASCEERERHPSPEEPPSPCCGGPSPSPGCCAGASPPPDCCGTEPCCRDLSCCPPGDLACMVRALRHIVQWRIGQTVAGVGVCIDVGQRADGRPYAAVDASRACTAPQP